MNPQVGEQTFQLACRWWNELCWWLVDFLFRGSGNINCMLEFCVGWGILFWFSTSCQLKFLNSDMFVDSSCQNFMSKRIKMSDFDPVGF